MAEDSKNPDDEVGIVFDDENDIMTSSSAFIPSVQQPTPTLEETETNGQAQTSEDGDATTAHESVSHEGGHSSALTVETQESGGETQVSSEAQERASALEEAPAPQENEAGPEVSSEPEAGRETLSEPADSVIVSQGAVEPLGSQEVHVGSSEAQRSEARVFVEPTPQIGEPHGIVQAGIPEQRVTFSNLQALVPERPVQESVEPVVRSPIGDAPSVVVIKPPSFGKFVLSGFLVILVLAGLFVGWRLDWNWNQLTQDPIASVEIVLGVRAMPTAHVEPAAPKVVVNNVKGRLQIKEMKIEHGQTKGVHSLKVIGTISNQSNRIQHAIMLKLKLVDDKGVAVLSRRLTCCERIKADGLVEPVHQIDLGQSASFITIFTSAEPFAPTLRPRARVVFSEAKSPQ